jgi:hypothetical protein
MACVPCIRASGGGVDLPGELPRSAAPYRRQPAVMVARRQMPHDGGATQGERERERARVGGGGVGGAQGHTCTSN